MNDNPVIFVGAGPGDPDLITIAGQKALAGADLVIHAGSLVNPEILSWCRPEAKLVDSAPLNLEEICSLIIKGWRAGQKVVRLHTGDPAIYGAIQEQMVILKKEGVDWKVIPGVTAALAAAATLGLELTMPEITQTFIITRAAGRTPLPYGEDLPSLASSRSSMAIYLSASQGQAVSDALAKAYGPEEPVALLYRVSWPDAKTIWTTCGKLAETLKDESLERHTLIMVGPALSALKSGRETPKSKLYDAAFSHCCRQAVCGEDVEAGTGNVSEAIDEA